ncbi:MAG: hypothetical protein WBB08_12565 [Halobacteriota archaeon]
MNYKCWVWDVKHMLLYSIEKAKMMLGYRPHTGFEDGLKKVHAWFIENFWDIVWSSEKCG